MPADALTIVHKFIRRQLFDVSAALSSAGPDDINTVKEAISQVTTLLHTHAEHEESGFEPKLREMNADHARRMLDDHIRLHAQLDEINVSCEQLRASPAEQCNRALLQLHLDWNRFVGGYLLHLDDEERTFFVGEGNPIPPITVMAEGIAAMEADEGAAFLQQIFAVVAPVERAAIEGALAD